MIIAPDWRPHSQLEKEVGDFLVQLGFEHRSMTYHSVLDREMQDLLGRNNDPTSQCVRTRADRIAVHKEIPECSFLWECKTDTGRRKNMAIEAVPLGHHAIARYLGVKSLYAYRGHGVDCGFWNDQLPPIDGILVPPGNESLHRALEFLRTFINKQRTQRMPLDHLQHIPRRGGSGDPFVLILESDWRTLPDWRTLIAEYVEKKAEAAG